MDSYDVIIIGTGAGGGTLARHLAPSGKRILLLERGDWLTREPRELGRRRACSSTTAMSPPDTWYDENGKAFQPQVHYFVGGATKLYGAALYRLRKEDFGELRHHDGISPAWPISYDELEPYYTLAEQHYEVHGARGEDPTEPPASAPYPFPAVSHEPRIQQLADQLEAAGYHPFHAPCGICLDEGNMPFSHCVRCATCDGFPCLVHAKSDAEVLGVRPALEHANVTLLTNAKGGQARDRRRRARRSPRSSSSTTGSSERYAGRLVVAVVRRRQHRQAPARARRTTSTRTASRTARTRSAATTCSTRARPCSPSPGRRTRPSSRRRSALNDFYFGADDFEFPLGNIQMVGKSPGADVPRREADRDEARARVDARADGQARDRLLALDRGPAAAREPGDASTATATSASSTRRPTTSRRSGSTRSSSRSSASWT